MIQMIADFFFYSMNATKVISPYFRFNSFGNDKVLKEKRCLSLTHK